MRKFLIPLAAAASTMAFAAPASAQWAPPVYSYNPYNFGYGFNGINFARTMESRVQRIRGDIRAMEMRRILSRRGPFSFLICDACAQACARCGANCEEHASHDPVMAACAKACRDCEKACKPHAEMHPPCKACMEACARCAAACEKAAA